MPSVGKVASKKIPHDKWIEVYNSILLLIWIRDLLKDQSSPEGPIANANLSFNDFCKRMGYPTGNQYIERGANIFTFGYLIIVRIKEIFDKSGVCVEDIYEKCLRPQNLSFQWGSFEGFTQRYGIVVKEFPSQRKLDDAKSVMKFITHLRHGISHFNYRIHGDEFELKSYDRSGKRVELHFLISGHQFLNFVAEYGVVVNNVVRDLNYLELS